VSKAKFARNDVVRIDDGVFKGCVGQITTINESFRPTIYAIKNFDTGQSASAYEDDLTLLNAAEPSFTQDELKLIRTAMVELNNNSVYTDPATTKAIFDKLAQCSRTLIHSR